MRPIPETIDTQCTALNEAWERYARDLIGPGGICVADSEEALDWDAFLGRSVSQPSMPGYIRQAGEGPDFSPLRERGITLRNLADLWRIEPLRNHLMHREDRDEAAAASCDLLLASGGPAGVLLCDAFRSLPKSSSHWSVRTLLQNAALLQDCDHSFRRWLKREMSALGSEEFPPQDFRRMVVVTEPNGAQQHTLERALQRLMGRIFHRAGGAAAAHILSDWQLGLWATGKTGVFDLFPYDSQHRRFVELCEDLPAGEDDFTHWWHAQNGCAELPPRLASACMACAVADRAADIEAGRELTGAQA